MTWSIEPARPLSARCQSVQIPNVISFGIRLGLLRRRPKLGRSAVAHLECCLHVEVPAVGLKPRREQQHIGVVELAGPVSAPMPPDRGVRGPQLRKGLLRVRGPFLPCLRGHRATVERADARVAP